MRKVPVFLSGVALGALALVAIDHMRLTGGANAAASDTYRRLTLFGDVFDKIRSDYVDKPDEAKLNKLAAAAGPTLSIPGVRSVRRMEVRVVTKD
jgi:carboxyl-terminal processing protease